MEDKILVSNEKENIEYSVYDEIVKIEEEDLDENGLLRKHFLFYIHPNNQVTFIYVKKDNVKFNIICENPLTNVYTFNSVRDFLLNESNTDEQKIEYIKKLLKDYLRYYKDHHFKVYYYHKN